MSLNKLQKITNGLLRDVAHSIYQGVLYLQYIVQFTVHHKRNSIYAHDKSMDFFSEKLTNAQQHFMHISHTEIHQNLVIHVESTYIN